MIAGIPVQRLPADWRYLPLGEFCGFAGGTQPPKSSFKTAPRDGYVRLLQIRDFETDAYATYVPCNGNLRFVHPDDVSIARYGASVGRILSGKSGAINVAIMKTDPNTSTALKSFLHFALRHDAFRRYLSGLGGRAAQAGFNQSEVGGFRFPIPPLSEQRKISIILSVAQRGIEQQDRLLALTTELKKTLLQKLFTEGVRGEPQKQTEIGPVPQSWQLRPCEDTCKLITVGIVVSMIHKFHGMPENINQRENIYVLIDEAHRTTGGDLGTYLMAAVPNATLIGFSGTPIDKTAYGKGTFKTFGCEDDRGYLHKYSIAESIQDGTTLPLYYNVAPNEILVPHELLDKEFLSLVETEGIADIEELNAVLERAVNLKNFLKGDNRVKEVARFVAEHYRGNVEPLGYKAFLVAVDRPACHKYKAALDQILPSEYSAVIMTTNNNDGPELKQYHLDDKAERAIRKNFRKFGEFPKILIVTEKLLTGYDAPILYSMYLDKPMRDHTLLQAIARVNRPYENERQEMVKPHGFVLDFIGIFENLEKALQFDSEEINAIVKDLSLLKHVFKAKMESVAPGYLELIHFNFDDRDNDNLIEHFRDKEHRKQFFKEYKEIEMLYEIISPDAFLRPYLDDYATLSGIYAVVRKAFSRGAQPDKEFSAKRMRSCRPISAPAQSNRSATSSRSTKKPSKRFKAVMAAITPR